MVEQEQRRTGRIEGVGGDAGEDTASVQMRELRRIGYQGVDVHEEEPLPEPEFADVTAALEELDETVTTVLSEDQQQTLQALGELRSMFPTVYALIMEQLQTAADAIAEGVRSRLQAVRELVDERVAPHAEVPDKLEAERDRERKQGEKVLEIARQVRELVEVEEWTGEAAEGYRRAALVQASALEELAGVEDSSSNALEHSALLNRAAFFYTAEAISFTASRIRALPTGDTTQLYRRSRDVESQLVVLRDKLSNELDAISDGETAKELATELGSLLSMPSVLLPTGWPTGGDAADLPPAPTGNAIPRLA